MYDFIHTPRELASYRIHGRDWPRTLYAQRRSVEHSFLNKDALVNVAVACHDMLAIREYR